MVMHSIESIKSDITMIIIAHRLSTLKQCNRIIKIENGKVVEDTTPEKIFLQK